jgi:hypothetical protein
VVAVVVIAKVADVEPLATVTLAGTFTVEGYCVERLTFQPKFPPAR